MVNTDRFGFAERFIIGIDAGYWLALLTQRETVTLPMVYGLEAARDPSFLDHLDQLDVLQEEITSQNALTKIQALGISHIFLGAKGGRIDADALVNSKYFTLLYKIRETEIYWVLPSNNTTNTIFAKERSIKFPKP